MNPSTNDYKTLFQIFYKVMNFCEGNGGEEDIEVIFLSAKRLEETCEKLENVGACENFEAKLSELWQLHGLKCVTLQFFKKASHHILTRYMVDDRFSESEVKLAIQQFITNRSEREFHEFVQQLAETNQIVESLRERSHSTELVNKYKVEHLLEELQNILINNGGDVEVIHSETTKLLSNDASLMKIFLDVLCLSDGNEITSHIQEVVALTLSNLLRDCDYINLYSPLFELNAKDFNSIVTKWHHFIEVFLHTIRVSIEGLRCEYSGDSYSWTVTGTSPCLTFDQIVALIVRCKGLPGIDIKVKEFLHQIKLDGFQIMAEDIIYKSQIK